MVSKEKAALGQTGAAATNTARVLSDPIIHPEAPKSQGTNSYKPNMLQWALWYAEKRGWHVLPLHVYDNERCSCNRPNCRPDVKGETPGKHPRTIGGASDASNNTKTIKTWWRQSTDANIGWHLGRSHAAAIDVDPRHGGDETWAAICDTQKLTQTNLDTVTADPTGGGGTHIVYKLPDGVNPDDLAGTLGPGVDVKKGNAYIVVAPSLHPSGNRYEWEASSSPADVELRMIPQALLDLLLAEGISGGETIEFSDDIPDSSDLAAILGSLNPPGDTELFDLITSEPSESAVRIGKSRSEVDQTVITRLRARGADADIIRSVFIDYPIGEKFREKGRHADGYLATGIKNADAWLEKKRESEPPPRTKAVNSPQITAILKTITDEMPALPERAQLPDELGADAAPWLDKYAKFSRKWSPRAYDGFHEAVGLWILSTTAARRVVLHFGGARYTPLFILLAARTSLWAKSTTVKIGTETLHAAGLSWLLAADAATPQKFIQDLTLRLPGDFDQLPEAQQHRVWKRLAFAGQRGWFYEEFGQHVHAMNRRDGPMADFRGIIRRFDDCQDEYSYGSIGRGTDIVENPYLALLGNLTPADLRQFAQRGATMWNDGFWARFAFVTPPTRERNTDRFPADERHIPPSLSEPLQEWHKRLGVPTVTTNDVLDNDGEATGKKRIESTGLTPKACTLGEGVVDAFYNYMDGLGDILEETQQNDFDGNYTRFAEKALRVAMLLASFQNNGSIELNHWARAQQITERWRAGLHSLYNQVNEPEPTETALLEEKILGIVERMGNPTLREISQRIYGLGSTELEPVLMGLVRTGHLEKRKAGRTERYSFPKGA